MSEGKELAEQILSALAKRKAEFHKTANDVCVVSFRDIVAIRHHFEIMLVDNNDEVEGDNMIFGCPLVWRWWMVGKPPVIMTRQLLEGMDRAKSR